MPFKLKGSTDFAAIERASIIAGLPITGLKALFALKKAVSPGEMSRGLQSSIDEIKGSCTV